MPLLRLAFIDDQARETMLARLVNQDISPKLGRSVKVGGDQRLRPTVEHDIPS